MQRITGQIHPLAPPKTFRSEAAVSDDFLTNKRDRRLMKHSSFVSRITSSKISKNKRRRPKNKLKTSLEGLAEALPELRSGEGGEEVLSGKIRHKSLKSKRGALKRKEKVVRGEMERFGASMALLNGSAATAVSAGTAQARKTKPAQLDDSDDDDDDDMGGNTPLHQQQQPQLSTAQATSDTSSRWAAIRGYISSTMEQNPAFSHQNK